MYKVNEHILFQKHYRIPENVTLLDYIKSNEKDLSVFENDGAIYVIVNEGEFYEYNCMASIVFDSILFNINQNKLFDDIAGIFNVEREALKEDYYYFVNQMLINGIVISM